MIMMNMNIHIW